MMLLNQFDYELPATAIATRPIEPRDASRLLVVGEGLLRDSFVLDLPNWLNATDLLVFNDSKVIPAQLSAETDKGAVELTIHKFFGDGRVLAFAKPGKRLTIGRGVKIAHDFQFTVQDKLEEDGSFLLNFTAGQSELLTKLDHYGRMPIPPYLHRKGDEKDKSDYQTYFAKQLGSVAAPTASLHYTPELLAALKAKGVQTTTITLHVGAGTFLPVRVENIDEHKMHSEYYEISAATVDLIKETKAKGGRIIPVGTTACRTLEAVYAKYGELTPTYGETDIFIRPGFEFKVVDALLTNFHQPKSTLMMLVSAFAGYDQIKAAYQHALAQNYRFLSYGDTCLLLKG